MKTKSCFWLVLFAASACLATGVKSGRCDEDISADVYIAVISDFAPNPVQVSDTDTYYTTGVVAVRSNNPHVQQEQRDLDYHGTTPEISWDYSSGNGTCTFAPWDDFFSAEVKGHFTETGDWSVHVSATFSFGTAYEIYYGTAAGATGANLDIAVMDATQPAKVVMETVTDVDVAADGFSEQDHMVIVDGLGNSVNNCLSVSEGFQDAWDIDYGYIDPDWDEINPTGPDRWEQGIGLDEDSFIDFQLFYANEPWAVPTELRFYTQGWECQSNEYIQFFLNAHYLSQWNHTPPESRTDTDWIAGD